MTISPFDYPGKHQNQEYGYVYLTRIDIGNKFIYKIGTTKNIKARMGTLRSAWIHVDLLAYGLSEMAPDIETHLHICLYEKYHLSFINDLQYPRFSDEFFKFNYDGIIDAIKLMKQGCIETVISPHFKEDIMGCAK